MKAWEMPKTIAMNKPLSLQLLGLAKVVAVANLYCMKKKSAMQAKAWAKKAGVPYSRPRRTILQTSDLISRSNGVSNLYLVERRKAMRTNWQKDAGNQNSTYSGS